MLALVYLRFLLISSKCNVVCNTCMRFRGIDQAYEQTM